MKKAVFFLLSLILTLNLFSQKGDERKVTPSGRAEFYKFLIPASINGSNIAPAASSSFNVEFGDDKVEFKYGQAFHKRTLTNFNDEGSKALKSSWFLSGNVGAPDGVSTLF